MQFTEQSMVEQPIQRFYWPENAINVTTKRWLDLNRDHAQYLTISRQRRGDYKPTILSRKRSECRLVITETEASNCFSINSHMFTNNNQHNFIKIHFILISS